jgi:hypothetical protein
MELVEAVWSGGDFAYRSCRGRERGKSRLIVFMSASLG